MLKNIKCIALDLDGTVLDSHNMLSTVTKEAIGTAILHGIHVVVASGRSYFSLPKEITSIPGIDYAITSNGAAIYHIPSDKKLHGYTLSEASVLKILELTKDYEIVYEAFSDGIAYADQHYVNDPVKHGASKRAVEYIKRTRNPEKDIKEFIKNHINTLDSIDVVVKDKTQKEYLLQYLQQEVPDVYITSSVNQLVEISSSYAGKHSGLDFIASLLHIDKSHIAAFGNAANDIDMMNHAEFGFAVANADIPCLEAADVIVRSNDENGVAEGIYQILAATEPTDIYQ